MPEILIVTYENTKKCYYFTPLGDQLASSIKDDVDKWIIMVDTKEVSDEVVEELKTCTIERFYELIW